MAGVVDGHAVNELPHPQPPLASGPSSTFKPYGDHGTDVLPVSHPTSPFAVSIVAMRNYPDHIRIDELVSIRSRFADLRRVWARGDPATR